MLSCFSCVWLFATLWTIAHQAPLVHGILQARILKWVVMLSSRGSSQPSNETHVSSIADRFFTHWGTWEALVPSCYIPFILCTVCLNPLHYKLHVIREFLLYCSQLCPVSPNSAYYMPSKSVLSNWLSKCDYTVNPWTMWRLGWWPPRSWESDCNL